MNKYIIPAVIVIAAILVGGVLLYNNYSSCQIDTETGDSSANISSTEAADKLLNFVNGNILRGQGVASLIDTTEDNGLYKVKFDVSGQEVEWMITKNGILIFPQTINLAEVGEPIEETGTTIGNFSISSADVCLEENKPVVYFFGSESCPHCVWEHPIIKEVAGKFNGLISYHENIDTETDSNIFSQYSTGGIPALVLGCSYYRVGSGEQDGAEAEAKNLTAIMCKLTGNQPEDVCSEVADLVNSIN